MIYIIAYTMDWIAEFASSPDNYENRSMLKRLICIVAHTLYDVCPTEELSDRAVALLRQFNTLATRIIICEIYTILRLLDLSIYDTVNHQLHINECELPQLCMCPTCIDDSDDSMAGFLSGLHL